MRGGELLGRFETFVNPGRADPADDHGAHRHHRSDAAARAAHRRGAAGVPRVRARRGDRRPQHPVRLSASSTPRSSRTATRGSRTGASTPSRSRAGSSATKCRTCGCARSPATSAPSVEPVHRAYADAAATAEVLHALLERAAAFGVLGLDDLLALPTMRAHPSAAKLALTSKLPRAPGRLPVPRPRRARALRRQGDQPAGARPLVLLHRRPAEGAAAAARDGAHRAPRVPRAVRGRGPRAAPDPAARAPLQPPVEVVAALRVPQAHRRAVPAPRS